MKVGPVENKPPVKPAPGECRSLLAEGAADFDAVKVARISQAMRDGRFSVDAGAIADKLIANARVLLCRSSH